MNCTICARRQDVDHYGCHRCEDITRRHLSELPAWHAAADPTPKGGSGEPVAGGERGLGVNVAALDIRHGGAWIAVLHSWTRLVEEERELTPAPLHHGDAAATIRWHVDFLDRHLTWVYESAAWCDEFHAEVAQLWRQGRGVVEGAPARGVSVTCPTEGCGRRITITDADAVVRCRHCGVERPAGLLGRASDEVYADMEAVSVATGVPERTLRDWAKRGYVRRRNGRYSLADVQSRVSS